MKVLVTGANGFVGHALIKRLSESGHEVTALVRSLDRADKKNLSRVHWIVGDLHDPKSLPELSLIQKAYFLVHGLKEENAKFEYQEAMCAVNFINWIRPSGASIVYLGALAPQNIELSPHLRSRLLTGAILGSSGIATIEFRASIVLGEGSLSFEMIKALSERLPFRPLFGLLDRPCQPLAFSDLLDYLEAALERRSKNHEVFEIGGPQTTTYGELLDLYIELSGLKRKKIKIPEVEIKVLLKALDYIIPEYSGMGKKLAESLEYPTVVTDQHAFKVFKEIKPKGLRVAMDLARANSTTHYPPLWEKDFLMTLLSDKLLTQSGLLSPELLKHLEKVGKLKDILIKR